jgi:hypothetical protein
MEQSREVARAKRIASVSTIQLFIMRKTNRLDSQEILFAVMRKMIVTLNAMLRDNTEWRPVIA